MSDEIRMAAIEDVKTIQFPLLGDERGGLVVIEGERTIPFEIKRAFYIYETAEGVVRGQHANRITDFMLINVSGKSKVKVIDSTGKSKIIRLNRPHYGVYIPHMLWKEMYDFSSDSVLLVLANTHYDDREYIRDFDEYLKIINT